MSFVYCAAISLHTKLHVSAWRILVFVNSAFLAVSTNNGGVDRFLASLNAS